MKISNNMRQPLVINLVDENGKPKDIHLRARGLKGSVSEDLTSAEIQSPEVQRLLTKKPQKIRLIG